VPPEGEKAVCQDGPTAVASDRLHVGDLKGHADGERQVGEVEAIGLVVAGVINATVSQLQQS
ncbi:MAG: hypothetical protein MUE41_01380, partial [Gemmatimonadaceae bacterium]|nr:hypothetical protein [Gemmatimonadaceae bacterium]